jgi:hypothetical protein
MKVAIQPAQRPISRMSRRQHPLEYYLLLGTLFLAALTAAILFAKPLTARQNKAKPSLELRVADKEGRIRVDWDASNPAIQAAQGATLEVEDGGAFNRYPVEASILRSGGLDYVRKTDDVLLTITLYHDGRPGLQSSVRRISPVGPQFASSQTPPERPQARSRRR